MVSKIKSRNNWGRQGIHEMMKNHTRKGFRKEHSTTRHITARQGALKNVNR